jgi:two-component system nitrogen regulation response regulator GlnG
VTGATPSTRVLVVDDDPEIRQVLVETLAPHGFRVATAADGRAALAAIRAEPPAVVLLDLEMPRMGGMEVLAALQAERREIPVIVLTGDAGLVRAVEAMRLGAWDYATKPFLEEDLLCRLRHALEHRALRDEVDALRTRLAQSDLGERMGPSAAVQKLGEQVRLVAGSNFSVLIQGETGAGKELVARAIHHQSERREGRFVALDCGAIPETLIESELFGYEKGAFTGADRRKEGHFELAAGGTLFLDEVANLPGAVQAKLLRVLQEREIQPLGARGPLPVDVRVIAATNLPLDGEMRAGRFRQDLYYRLNEFTIVVPPLRERTEDILYLAQRFLDEVAMELRRPVRRISEEARRVLLAHPWPGNARELKSVIRRAALVSGEVIEPAHLTTLAADVGADAGAHADAEPPTRAATSLREIAAAAAADAEREAIRQALVATRGNKSEAARLLRTDFKTLHLKMKRYGIPSRE